MHSLKDDFLKFQAKTNPYPLSLEIKKQRDHILRRLMERNI